MGLPNAKSQPQVAQRHVRAHRESQADKRNREAAEQTSVLWAQMAAHNVEDVWNRIKSDQQDKKIAELSTELAAEKKEGDTYRRLDQQKSRISNFLFVGYQSLYSAAVQASADFVSITKKEVESGLQEAFFNALFGLATIVAPELVLIAGAAKIAKTANAAKDAAEAAELAKGASTAIKAARVAREASKLAQETKEGVAKVQEGFKKDIEAGKGVTELFFNLVKVSDGIAAEDANLLAAENMAEVRKIFKTLDDARAIALVPLIAASTLLGQKDWFAFSGAIQKLLDGIQMPGKQLDGKEVADAFDTSLYADFFLYDLLKEYTRRHVVVQWGQPIASIGPMPPMFKLDVVPPQMVEVEGMDGREIAYERLGSTGPSHSQLMRSGRPPINSFRDLVKVWGAPYQRKKWFW